MRRMTKQHSRGIDAVSMATLCELALKAGGWIESDRSYGTINREVYSLCSEILYGHSDSTLERELSRVFDFDVHMDGTREERVLALTALIENLPATPKWEDRALPSLALGFLVSRIAPGTIQHASLLEPVLKQYPEAVIWYGFCAGNSKRNATQRSSPARSNSDLPSIGRWIVRSILRAGAPWDAPDYDISWKELFSLFQTGRDPLSSIIRATPGLAVIELSPLV